MRLIHFVINKCHNPIHLKKDFAVNSDQKDCVVNGALTLSFAIGYLMENKKLLGALILELNHF